jgi:3-oxoacyl-[acyl-carrier-protein] synthase-3
MEKAGRDISEIDFIIFTQININTIHDVMKELDLPLEKTHWIMDRYGYTGSACIPMVLDEAVRSDKIKKGDLVVLVGSGGGYAMGAIAFEW